MINKFVEAANSWDDFYDFIKNESFSGKIFEEFSKLYFLLEPSVKNDYKNVWLYNEIPLTIKENLNLGSVEHGIDLLLERKNGEFTAVQCKFRTNQEESLGWSKDKIANLFAYGDKCDSFIVFSNTSKLDNVSLTRKSDFQFLNLQNLLEIKQVTFEAFKEYAVNGVKKEVSKYEPKNHQKEAIEKVSEYFLNNSRSQLILPCGAGKTLTALWIKEDLKAQNTIVLVPSLALLRQIKNSWNEQCKEPFAYICVCSEQDIDSEKYDSPVANTYEIGGKVTTDENEIWDFLNKNNDSKVIFSTYQSLPKIRAAIDGKDFSFDLAICDEAHRTAGAKSNGSFGLIHSNENIKILKRLYMTATPKIVSENLKTRLGLKSEELLYDMSDEKVFGGEAYRMSFKKAIDLGILVDYKILGIGVSDKQVSEWLENRKLVNTNESIENLANNYALDLVMSKYGANHAISFHSRVVKASYFSKKHKYLFKEIYAESVSGEQTTTHRNLILNEFKNQEKGLISNARCLTEGVDVPVIDLIYFADPKNSKVDIVQAAGRALRIDKHGNKKLGYIVVPIFHHQNKDMEKAIDEGVFRNLVNVIRSLCDQDERLQDEINKLAFQKGKRTALGERLDIIFEEAEENVVNLVGFDEKLKNALFDQVIEKASNNWGVKYENLKLWREIYPDRWPRQLPPKRRTENTSAIVEENSLGVWLMAIRKLYRDNTLDTNWVDKFNKLNFVWDYRELQSDNKFDYLKKYLEEKGRLPKASENTRLYSYLLNFKLFEYENGTIEKKFKELLDKYDFQSWVREYRKSWDDWLQEVVEYKNKFGKFPYSTSDKTNPMHSLGVWLSSNKQKYRDGILEKVRIEKLLDVGVDFTDRDRHFEVAWDKQFQEVKIWYKENGSWPKSQNEVGSCKEGKLGNWLLSQKNWYRGNSSNKSEYPEERKKKLLEIGYSIERTRPPSSKTDWETQFDYLEEFKKQNPNRWPTSKEQFPEGNNLGAWCSLQKQNHKKNTLAKFRKEMLESIEFNFGTSYENFDAFCSARWIQGYEKVKNLLQKGAIFNKKNNLKEHMWIYSQKNKFKKRELDDEKIELLKEINIL